MTAARRPKGGSPWASRAAAPRHEGIAVAGGERRDDRVLGGVGLEHDPAGASAAPGAPAHLVEELVGALGRPHVAARQPQVGIDHAHQGELREVMPLGHHLRADQHVDLHGPRWH